MDAPTAEGDPLAGYPLVITWPVQWGDQDAFGHVNNTIYFRWFETVRIEYFERIGFNALLMTDRIGPILASIKCDFRSQLKHPDTLRLGARVTRIGRTSIGMEHRIVSTATGALAAEGDSTIVVFDYTTNRPHPVPADIRAAIERVEGHTF